MRSAPTAACPDSPGRPAPSSTSTRLCRVARLPISSWNELMRSLMFSWAFLAVLVQLSGNLPFLAQRLHAGFEIVQLLPQRSGFHFGLGLAAAEQAGASLLAVLHEVKLALHPGHLFEAIAQGDETGQVDLSIRTV